MDNSEVCLKLCQEYSAESRHHEQQRATVTGIFAALATAILTIVSLDNSINMSDLPAAIFLLVIGVFGCVFSYKEYERVFVCMERARQFRLALETVMPESNILKIKKIADNKTKERFPKLHVWKLGLFWDFLNAMVGLFGILLIVLAIIGVDS